MTTGKELTKIGKAIMEAAGWVRLACFNSYRAMPRGARGISDNIYIRDGVLLFIEDKGTGDTIRIEQALFAEVLKAQAPAKVFYMISESAEDYERYAVIGSEDES